MTGKLTERDEALFRIAEALEAQTKAMQEVVAELADIDEKLDGLADSILIGAAECAGRTEGADANAEV